MTGTGSRPPHARGRSLQRGWGLPGGHRWGLSHGHGQRRPRSSRAEACGFRLVWAKELHDTCAANSPPGGWKPPRRPGARRAADAPSTPQAPSTRAAAVLPGLWDCHGHLIGARSLDLTRLALEPLALRAARCAGDLRAALDAGVTSVREVGGLGVYLARAGGSGALSWADDVPGGSGAEGI